MLRNTILAGLFGAILSTAAVAQNACPCAGGTQVTGVGAIGQLLRGKTACAVLGNERWQEFHQTGGALFELGNVTPLGEEVGTWDVVLVNRVRYSYGAGGAGGVYDYNVCTEGASVHFCGSTLGGRNITNATLNDGRAACVVASKPQRSIR